MAKISTWKSEGELPMSMTSPAGSLSFQIAIPVSFGAYPRLTLCHQISKVQVIEGTMAFVYGQCTVSVLSLHALPSISLNAQKNLAALFDRCFSAICTSIWRSKLRLDNQAHRILVPSSRKCKSTVFSQFSSLSERDHCHFLGVYIQPFSLIPSLYKFKRDLQSFRVLRAQTFRRL